MMRDVSAHFEVATTGGPCQIVYAVAVAQDTPVEHERVEVTADGAPIEPVELVEAHGTRLHRVTTEARNIVFHYEATGVGERPTMAPNDTDLITYLRPSRYCEADALGPTAAAEFAGLTGVELLTAVGQWVHERLIYVAGSSKPTDSAEETLLARRGVCRDYSHLVIALLRAMTIPARLTAVYAPGLSPMEFHAVAEGFVDGQWRVVDATRLAPRQTLVRVATGRDAADTAFITNYGANLFLNVNQVTAIVTDGDLPFDDHQSLVSIS